MHPTTKRPTISRLLLTLSLALATLPPASASAAPAHSPGFAHVVHATDDVTAEPEQTAEPALELESLPADPPVVTDPVPPPAKEPPVDPAPVADVPAEVPADPLPPESTDNDDSGDASKTAEPVPASETSETFIAAATTNAAEDSAATESDDQPETSDDFTAAALPIAVDDVVTVQQGRSTGGFSVLDNDTDPDGDNLDIVSVTQPANGSVLLLNGATGSMQYTPNAGFVGADTFTYVVSDGTDSDTGTVTVDVTNTPPEAVDDAVTVQQGRQTPAFLVLDNDLDADGDNLDVTSITQPANGSAVLLNGATGSTLYRPNAGFVGIDTFTYAITDGAATDTATVAIQVTNTPPQAVDDNVTVQQGQQTPGFSVLDNDADADGDNLDVTSITQPANGSAVLLNGATGSMQYTPNAGFVGSDSFTYVISDGATTATATVTITVTPVNAPPVANDDTATTLHGRSVTIPVLANDTGDSLTIDAVSAPTSNRADIVVNPDGTVTYTPDVGGFVIGPFGLQISHDLLGPDSFTYTISDGTTTDTATVNLTVTNTPPPTALNHNLSTEPGVPLTIDLLANTAPDSDGDPLLAFIDPFTNATGTLTTVDQTNVRFVPAPGFTGEVLFAYLIWDGAAVSDALVTICVGDCDGVGNAPPVANDDDVTTAASTPIDIDVLANDTDPDGDELDIPVVFPVSVPANGSAGVSRTANGSLVVYTPDLGFVGTDTFTYLVSDGEATDTGTVTVTVLATQENQPPVAVDDTATTTEGEPVTIDVLANDFDPDDGSAVDDRPDLFLESLDQEPAHGTVTGNPDDTITYTPAAGFVGTDQFTYTIADGSSSDDSAPATVTITVTGTAPEPEPKPKPEEPKNEETAPKQPAKPASKPAANVATTLPDTGVGPATAHDNHGLLLGMLMMLFGTLAVLQCRRFVRCPC